MDACEESRSSLFERLDGYTHAHVTFERVTDVPEGCPRCGGLMTRRLGPGVTCSCSGRLGGVRELLARELV
jgi:hypothetical protein